MVTPASERSPSQSNKSIVQPLVDEKTAASTINTMTNQSSVNEQFAAQLRDLSTVTENLREQLATQT